MHARLVLIAAAIVTSASAAAADPAKPGNQAQPATPKIMLASADGVRSPVAAEQQAPAAPKRPRMARVTSCRCGDPQAQQQQ